LAAWLYVARPIAPADRDTLAQGFVEPEKCRPEPEERRAYLAGVVLLPLLIFGAACACHHWAARRPFLVRPHAVRLTEVMLAYLGLVFAAFALGGDDCYHVRMNAFFERPLATVPLFALSLAALGWK